MKHGKALVLGAGTALAAILVGYAWRVAHRPNPDFPLRRQLRFSVEVTNGSGIWHSNVEIPVPLPRCVGSTYRCTGTRVEAPSQLRVDSLGNREALVRFSDFEMAAVHKVSVDMDLEVAEAPAPQPEEDWLRFLPVSASEPDDVKRLRLAGVATRWVVGTPMDLHGTREAVWAARLERRWGDSWAPFEAVSSDGASDVSVAASPPILEWWVAADGQDLARAKTLLNGHEGFAFRYSGFELR